MTITKAQLVNMLDGVKDNTPMYVRTSDSCMECELVTAQDIIDECMERVELFDEADEIDVNTAIQELADFDDSIQFYEIDLFQEVQT